MCFCLFLCACFCFFVCLFCVFVIFSKCSKVLNAGGCWCIAHSMLIMCFCYSALVHTPCVHAYSEPRPWHDGSERHYIRYSLPFRWRGPHLPISLLPAFRGGKGSCLQSTAEHNPSKQSLLKISTQRQAICCWVKSELTRDSICCFFAACTYRRPVFSLLATARPVRLTPWLIWDCDIFFFFWETHEF